MNYQGVLRKMNTSVVGGTAQYFLTLSDEFILLNQCIGKELSIQFTGYECLHCGKDIKIFRQGLCYEHFYSQPQAGDWIMRPELSKAHLGIEDRDLAFEEKVQLQPHIVYLANSGTVKVGVTRKSQVPTRWIDQGAHTAIPLIEVPNRYLAGISEVALKAYIADKTNWRKMLKNEVTVTDLREKRKELLPYLPEEVKPYIKEQEELWEIDFPVEAYPSKVNSLSLTKKESYQGVLKGVKGQYLLFQDGTVFNVRSHEGFKIQLAF